MTMLYRVLADIILVVHFLFILFVVAGLLLIVLGLIRKWRWVRNFWFRLAHLISIGIVVAQAWSGIVCPLTIWENDLRRMGTGITYEGSFIQYWLHKVIFFQADMWVFTLVYSIFGLLVLATWVFGKPNGPGQNSRV